MNHNRYIGVILLAGLFSWLGWFLVFSKLSPIDSPVLALTFFFLTLFIALVCTFTIVGFYFRVWLFKEEAFYRQINLALRQGLILAALVVVSLLLQSIRVLTWWSGILLIGAAVLVEMYLSTRDSEYV